MKANITQSSIILFNKLKVHFLLQAEENLSILSPYPEVMKDFKEGIELAWLSFSNNDPEIYINLINYRPDNLEDFPTRCASSYEFPQSAYIAFTGEILYLIGSNEAPNLPTRTPLVEEGLVCGALERKLACHYLKLIAIELYPDEVYRNQYFEKIKEFEKTLCCDVPELLPL